MARTVRWAEAATQDLAEAAEFIARDSRFYAMALVGEEVPGVPEVPADPDALVPQVLLGRHMENDLLLFRRATRLEIECDPPMAFNVDGELIGEGTARFEILPRALRVIAGPRAEEGVLSAA